MFNYFKYWISYYFYCLYSGISIGISAWQYTSNSAGLQIYYSATNEVNFCDAYPYTYLRPIRFTWTNGVQQTTNCGWSVGDTSYRIAAAVATILMTFAYIFAFCGTEWLLCLIPYEILFYIFISVLWFTVSVVDITTLCNAALSCTDLSNNLKKYFDFSNNLDNFKCNVSIYGITIAIDLAIAILVTVRCITAIYYGSTSGTQGGANSQPPAKAPSVREVQVTTKSAGSTQSQAATPKSFNESPSWMTPVDDA